MGVELVLLTRPAYRDREIAGGRLLGLLALLAGDLRAGCGTARLVDGLWPDEPPQHPAKALQIVVSRARAQLGPEVIARTATGYRLCLREDQVDVSAVLVSASASARQLRAGDPGAALRHAEAGLAMFDGAPEQVSGDDPLAALRAERAGTHRSLARTRAIALARLGRAAEAVEPLTELARQEPRDEDVLLELVRCEAATAGPSAALARYEDYRRSVRDELGTDPGPALQALHRQLLRGESPVATRHGVPHEPNPLLGREEDIAAVAELLRTARVTSIVGPGGLGKTRLAHAVSRRARQPAVHVVPLAGVTADADVAAEVAAVLGVGDAPHRSPPAPVSPTDPNGIVAALATGPVLLVLDNCEQVIDGVAELVQALVSKTEELRVLTTSRRPLGLSSESVYPLPELDLPTCVELFRQRARAARPGIDLPPELVEALCRHLDGLPLAVELAAARVRAMSVAEVVRRLEDRFALLRGGPRDAPRRHHTLHDVVDWSWGLLAADGQAAMRALSAFPGGFTVAAAAYLLGMADPVPVLEHLVDQSLLRAVDTPAGTRFHMLETIREFSAARRDGAGETEPVAGAFLAWARDFGLAHHEELFGADWFTVAQRVRAEQDNLVQAMRIGLARADGPAVAAIGAVLGALWTVDAKHDRVVSLAAELAWPLSHYRPEPRYVTATRTLAVVCTAYGLLVHGPRANRWLVLLRRLPAAPTDTLGGACATALAAIPEIGADPQVLFELCDRPQPLVSAIANVMASYYWEARGEPDRALAAAERVLDAVADFPGALIRVMAHSRVGELCANLGHSEEARRQLTAAVRLLEASGPWTDVIQLRWGLALVNLQLGDVDEAERWLALAERDGTEHAYGLSAFDSGIRAEILLVRGDVPGGLRLWRRAVDQVGTAESSFYRSESTGLAPWELEVQSAAVVAHAYHGRLDAVGELARSLPEALAATLRNPTVLPPSAGLELPMCGTLLLAVAMLELDRGRRATAARMIALAQRLRFTLNFQPTMSPARARHAAEQADRDEYERAVARYADLGGDELRNAALAVLEESGTASDRA